MKTIDIYSHDRRKNPSRRLQLKKIASCPSISAAAQLIATIQNLPIYTTYDLNLFAQKIKNGSAKRLNGYDILYTNRGIIL
jgi:hypothetical protein